VRYEILKPICRVDPSSVSFASLDDLRIAMPQVVGCTSEEEAVHEVRQLCPDAITMPTPVAVGSGTITLLGVIPFAAVSGDLGRPDDIPYAYFVYAIPDNGADRMLIKGRRSFSRDLWKLPVLHPPTYVPIGEREPGQGAHRVSLRANDFDNHWPLEAVAFTRHGKQVIYLAVNHSEISIEFLDPSIVIARRSS